MPVKKYISGIVCSCSCLLAVLLTQTSWAESVSLNDIIASVIASNPALQASHASQEAMQANLAQKKGAFFPSVDFRSSFNRTNSPPGVFTEKLFQEQFTQEDFSIKSLNDPSARSNWKNEIILTQPVFNRGTEYIGCKSAAIELEMERFVTDVLTMQVVAKAEEAYIKALLALDAEEAASASLRATEEIESLARKKYLAGLALKADVLAVQVKKNEAISLKAAAKADYKNAIAAINRLAGNEKLTESSKLQAVSCANMKLPAQGIDDLVKTALENRPDLKLAKQNIEQADVGVLGAKFGFLPSLNLMASWENNAEEISGASGNAWGIGAVVSLNLFNGDKDRQKLLEANANKRKSQFMLDDMINQVKLEVKEAFNALLTVKSQMELAASSVGHAEENLRIMQSRYEAGMALMVETLEAEASLRQARLALSDALFKWRITDVRLRLATGTILNRNYPV